MSLGYVEKGFYGIYVNPELYRKANQEEELSESRIDEI